MAYDSREVQSMLVSHREYTGARFEHKPVEVNGTITYDLVATHAALPVEAGSCESCKGGECIAHETFICGGCGLIYSWECGAADDLPDNCDSCWLAAHPGEDADAQGD